MECKTEQLAAGRELDAMVEVKVFGGNPGLIEMARRGELDVQYGGDPGIGCRPDDVFVPGPPQYSTDIAAALDVLCVVRGDVSQGVGHFSIHPSSDDNTLYDCVLYGRRVRGTGRTISEAICHAALQACNAR